MLRSKRSLNSLPFNVMIPVTASILCASASISVDLPEPLGPMTARISPSLASPVMPPSKRRGFGSGCVDFPGHTARWKRCHRESFLHTVRWRWSKDFHRWWRRSEEFQRRWRWSRDLRRRWWWREELQWTKQSRWR